jgi:hypothetical protein
LLFFQTNCIFFTVPGRKTTPPNQIFSHSLRSGTYLFRKVALVTGIIVMQVGK